MRTIWVEVTGGRYPVFIGPSVCEMLQKSNILRDHQAQTGVIADQTVAYLHLERLTPFLPTNPLVLTFPSGEASKSLQTAAALYDRLAAAGFQRTGLIVAFGGGVAGDLAGFVAATWHRGVRFIQVPTTLLAAVDASVGGKTALNLPAGKNLIGAFHQPVAVVIDTDFLQTLSDRDLTAGMAEAVKQAALRDPGFLDWQERSAGALRSRNPDAITELIARSCEIKSEIVSQDERESGLRAILNYGHTIGHAIEHLTDYELRHGECVAIGMVVENELACTRGLLAPAEATRLRDLLTRLGLPTRLARPLDGAQVARACRADKKVRGSSLGFVLLRAIGQPMQVTDVSDAEVVAALDSVQPV